MMDLFTTEGIIYNNNDIEPIDKCKRCNSKNLKHDFSGGFYSEDYSNTECLDCKFYYGPTMGGWVGSYDENEYSLMFCIGFENNQFKKIKDMEGASLSRKGYVTLNGDTHLSLGNLPMTVSLKEVLETFNITDDSWKNIKDKKV